MSEKTKFWILLILLGLSIALLIILNDRSGTVLLSH